jgi:hypothetical protein
VPIHLSCRALFSDVGSFEVPNLWNNYLPSVPWIHERLTVELSANFRDWTIIISQRAEPSQSMKETQTINPWKKKLKTTENINVFQIGGMDQMERRSVVHFL